MIRGERAKNPHFILSEDCDLLKVAVFNVPCRNPFVELLELLRIVVRRQRCWEHVVTTVMALVADHHLIVQV